MAYIRKVDYTIFVDAPKEEVGNQKKYDFFECEELIAPAVCALMKKGYSVTKSSIGHIGLKVEGECLVSQDNEMTDAELKQFFADTMCYHGCIDIQPAKKNRRKVILINEVEPDAFIELSAAIDAEPPEGWYKDKKVLRHRFEHTTGSKFYLERVDAMVNLYHWAKELPPAK